MYAIVKTGGKQYRVERGQTLLVERLSADTGANVALEPILYRSEDVLFDAAALQKVKVTAKVIGHERGEKLRVFKFKPKRGYKRRTGHRQELTRIEVTDISMGAAAKRAGSAAAGKGGEAKTAAKPAAVRASKLATEAGGDAKAAAKPAASKAAAEKTGDAKAAAKPAAKKPAAKKPAAKKPAASKPAAEKEDSSDGS